MGNMAEDTVALGRFLAEARAAGKINHPNVVTVYEIAQDGPTHYIALELVASGSAEYIGSSEHAVTGYRPKLVVQYYLY